jgi:hypothetical protein
MNMPDDPDQKIQRSNTYNTYAPIKKPDKNAVLL